MTEPEKPLRYSELSPAMVDVLRIYRAVEMAYPQGPQRATQTLAGFEVWRKKRSRMTPQAGSTGPGMIKENNDMASRDPQRKPLEVSGA